MSSSSQIKTPITPDNIVMTKINQLILVTHTAHAKPENAPEANAILDRIHV